MFSDPVNFIDPNGLIKISFKGYTWDTKAGTTTYTQSLLTLTMDKDGNFTLTGDISRKGGACSVSSNGTVNCNIEAAVKCDIKADKDKNVLDVKFSFNFSGLYKSTKVPVDVMHEAAIQSANHLKKGFENSDIFNPAKRLEKQLKEAGLK